MLIKLYQINEEFMNAIQSVDENGELTTDPEKLEELAMVREQKIDNCIMELKNLEAEASAIEAHAKIISDEYKSISGLAKSKRAEANRFKNYLLNQMKFTGEDKMESAHGKLTIRKAPPALVIDSTEFIPAEFKKVEEVVIKDELKTAIKNGLEVEGVRIEQKEYLNIR